MSLVVIDRDKKFHNHKLFPFIPHHKDYIERALAGMSLGEEETQKSTYKGFVKWYLSYGISLKNIDLPPTFENARDEEKLAAGWEKNAEGVLVPPAPKKMVEEPKVEVSTEEPKEEKPKKKK